jgi:hypothetical protein
MCNLYSITTNQVAIIAIIALFRDPERTPPSGPFYPRSGLTWCQEWPGFRTLSTSFTLQPSMKLYCVSRWHRASATPAKVPAEQA